MIIKLKWKCKVKVCLSILFNLMRSRYNGVAIQKYVCDSGKFPYSKPKQGEMPGIGFISRLWIQTYISLIPNICFIYMNWAFTVSFSSVWRCFKITKTCSSSIVKVRLKENLNQQLKTDNSNHFKDLLINMQFSRAILPCQWTEEFWSL